VTVVYYVPRFGFELSLISPAVSALLLPGLPLCVVFFGPNNY
jgi:hypothetical protein